MSEELESALNAQIRILHDGNEGQRKYIAQLEKIIRDDADLINTLYRWLEEARHESRTR